MGSILVTGVTGTVGRSVAENLVAAGEHVVSAVRDPSARVVDGTEPRAFDFAPGTDNTAAFAGVDRLFLMRPPAISDVASTMFPVIDEARRRGIRHIVFLSLQGVQFNRSTPHHAVEKYLRKRKAPYTFLRPNFFMQNLSTVYAEEIRNTGQIYLPAANARTAFIDARDIGLVAATVFSGGEHLGKAYTLSGEESLTYYQVAQAMTEVLGRPITYARPTPDEYLEHLRRHGAPAEYIDVQKMIYRIVRLNVSAGTNRMVKRITGEPATTLRQFVADYRGAWEREHGAGAPR